MSDHAWMYTGYTSQKVWTEEWLTKTKGLLEPHLQMARNLAGAPVSGATTIIRGTSFK